MGWHQKCIAYTILNFYYIVLLNLAVADIPDTKLQNALNQDEIINNKLKQITLGTVKTDNLKRREESFIRKMIQQNVFHNRLGPILETDKRGKYKTPANNRLPTKTNSVEKSSKPSYARNTINKGSKFMPYLRVVVDGRKATPRKFYKAIIPLSPDMTVFESIFAAALQFHRKNKGKMNPFNVMLDWNYRRYCEAIIFTAGIANTDQHQWIITVTRRRGRIIYKDPCLPYTRMRLRPGTVITLKYM